MSVSSRSGEKKPPQDILEAYRDEDISTVMALATRLLDAEGKRVEILERKGTQLIGFGSVSIALLSLTLSQAVQISEVSVVLLVIGVLVMVSAVYCGIRTVKTQMLVLPDETAISNHDSALEMHREHTQDLLSALRDQGEKSRKKGWWLQLGECAINVSIIFLGLGLVAVLLCR